MAINRVDERVSAVRRFSRFYTRTIGLLSEGILDSPYSLTEARVIYELGQRGASTGSRLAVDLGLDQGYISRVLRRFERRGLIVKQRSDEDQRRVVIQLTRAGREAFDTLDSGSRSQVVELLDRLSTDDQARLVTAMATIEATLGHVQEAPRVTYRSHAPGDMGWIVQRHGELYHASHGWDESFEAMVAGIVARFVEKYDPAYERSWIAEVDGRRAGAIALVRRSKKVGQLRLLFVEPWARGLGIGARLVSECVGQARHVGYSSMVLFTVRGLDAARSLYEAEGFQLTDETPGHAWGGDHIAQTWELTL
jgi:DNA-binding MarR family transcriptional regulator/N-acetylglutamate synthase-like GNAT family acetyltransferase